MLKVEDGSGLTDADSYVSEAEFSAYARQRGLAGIAALDEAALGALLLKAMDWLELKAFAGKPTNPAQSLAFPRGGVVPPAVKKAQMVLAAVAESYSLMPNYTPTGEGAVASKTVGEVGISYHAPAKGGAVAYAEPYFAEVEALLAPFLARGQLFGQAVAVRS